MAYSHLSRITCFQCQASYNSETELNDHMHAAHRRCVSETSTLPNLHQVDLCASKNEWVVLSVQLRNRLRTRFYPEELEVVDRFILLGSVVDDVRH